LKEKRGRGREGGVSKAHELKELRGGRRDGGGSESH